MTSQFQNKEANRSGPAEGSASLAPAASALRRLAVPLLLALTTWAAFAPVGSAGFLDVDDPLYVTENRQVRSGLTPVGVRWAFTTLHAGNWHPLTWISHMLDVQLFGLNPGAHHLVNLALHTANVLLLYLLLRGLTGAIWPSALAAALFAVHPLRAESVAWLAERKDVLSACFWLAACLAYLRYLRGRRPAAYVALLGLFALGIAAKPMAVTLPFVLLLLDYWPLGRLLPGGGAAGNRALAGLIREKMPLFALSALSAAVTLTAQGAGKMIKPLTDYPIGVRIANALVSYCTYLGKAIVPTGLAFPYAHPGNSLTLAEIGGAGLVLLAATTLALRLRQRAPILPVGWFWFLGMLVPVIGLVQVSDQARADRYTYLPMIGLAWALAWGALAATAARPRLRAAAGGAAVIAIAVLVVLTRRQVGYWHDDRSLYAHTATVTRQENLARRLLQQGQQVVPNTDLVMAAHEALLGDKFLKEGRLAEAVGKYEKSLELSPWQIVAHERLGDALARLGRQEEATRHRAEAARMTNAVAEIRTGDQLRAERKIAEAIERYENSLAYFAEQNTAHNRLGDAFMQTGRYAEAVRHFAEAVRIAPDDARATANLARARLLMAQQGGAKAE